MTYEIPYSFYGDNRTAILCREREHIVSGPAETGKTLAVLFKLHTLAYKYPGAHFSIIRKKKTDLYGTVIRTFTRDLLDKYGPGVTAYGGGYPQWFDYPNGSRIWLAGMDDPAKTLSAERDAIYVNQAEEMTAADWEYLTRCVTGRGAVMPYTFLIGDCNPSHRQHWILQRETAGRLTVFRTTHRDNPILWDNEQGQWTAQGERTLAALSNLTGARLQRLYYGKWANPEGAIFEIFDDTKHKCRAFVPPPHWARAVGVDPLGAYVAAIWGAFDPQGRVMHIYREYMEPFGATTEKHVENILHLSKGESVWHWYGGGPSERQQRADFAGHGLPLRRVEITDVWSQVDKILELLMHDAIMIHDSCPNLLSQIGAYRRKVTRDGQITDSIESKDEYHLIDSLRYMIAGLVGNEISMISYQPVRVGTW